MTRRMMRNTVALLLGLGLGVLLAVGTARAEDQTVSESYRAVTPDFTVSDKAKIEVEKKEVIIRTFKYTLEEVDWYLGIYKAQRAQMDDTINFLQNLRDQIEKAANEVQLGQADPS